MLLFHYHPSRHKTITIYSYFVLYWKLTKEKQTDIPKELRKQTLTVVQTLKTVVHVTLQEKTRTDFWLLTGYPILKYYEVQNRLWKNLSNLGLCWLFKEGIFYKVASVLKILINLKKITFYSYLALVQV